MSSEDKNNIEMGEGGSENFDCIMVVTVTSKNRGKSIFSQHLMARIIGLTGNN